MPPGPTGEVNCEEFIQGTVVAEELHGPESSAPAFFAQMLAKMETSKPGDDECHQRVRSSRQAAVLAVREKVEGWGQIAFLLLFGSSRKGWCSNTRRRPNLHLVPT